MSRSSALRKARRELETLKNLKERAREWSDNPWVSSAMEDMDIDEKIEQATEFVETATAVSDLVSAAASGDTLSMLDTFIDQYGNHEVDIFDTGIQEVSLGPWFGCLNVDIGFSADMSGELKSERKGSTIESDAEITANGRARIGISVGFDIPLVGDCKLGGGVKGGPSMTGEAGINLVYESPLFKAILDSATLTVDMVAELYLGIPDFVPDILLEKTADWISGLEFEDSRSEFSYEFARINILVVRTPSYSLSFNLDRGQFRYHGAVGSYDIDLNDDVKQLIKDIKDSIVSATEYLNPLNWDIF